MTADELRNLRARLELTQAQLAKRVGVATNTLARWERGEMPIPGPASKLLESFGNTSRAAYALSDSTQVILDPHHGAIIQALQGRLDPEAFEACSTDLLRKDWPGLVPVRGGSDDGFDGAIADKSTEPFPLIATTSGDPARNLKNNLAKAKKRGKVFARAIFATSRRITPKMRAKLNSIAAKFDVELAQIYEQDWFASVLYRHPEWCRRLLDVTGRPSALSVYPQTNRPIVENRLIGRDEEIEWLIDQENDCLIVGGPGTGKTFLLRELALQGRALFLVDADREAIANAVRKLQPPAIIIDDAHVNPRRVAKLAQLREEIQAQFRIIATSWPAESKIVANALSLPSAQILQLRLVDADSIVEIIKGVGLHGPNQLLRIIREQAEGRPGLAVTLAWYCLIGDVQKVVSGESLVDQLEPVLDNMLDMPSLRLLAPFAIGGSAGARQEAVAHILEMPIWEVSDKLARLAAAGIVREAKNGAVSVWPAPMRWTIVRRVLFDGPHSLDYMPMLEHVENKEEAVHTLLGARSRGASIPELAQLVEDVGSERIWAEYASLGAAEAQYTLSRNPQISNRTLETCLDHIPDMAIPKLLESARTDYRKPHQAPDHALRRLKTWATGVSPNQADVVQRRAIIVDAVKQWWLETKAVEIAIRAMRIALTPSFETTSTDPGRGRTLTISWGRLRDKELKAVANLWSSVVEMVRGEDEAPWNELIDLVRDWLFPDTRVEASSQTRNLMRDVAARMLGDLSTISRSHPGVQHRLRELAQQAEISLEIPIDKEFEVLYPPERFGQHDGDADTSGAVENLVKSWRTKSIEEIAQALGHIEHEAQLVGISYPRHSIRFCELLAQDSKDPVIAGRTFLDRRLSPDLIAPFAREAMNTGAAGWQELLAECIAEDSCGWVGVSLLLTAESPPAELLNVALRSAGELSQVVEVACLRGEVPMKTLQTLLTNNDLRVAVAAAIGHWQADRKDRTRAAFPEEWQRAIIRSADVDEHSSHDNFWIGKILADDPDLAVEWLVARLSRNEKYLHYDVKQIVNEVVPILEVAHRRTILAAIKIDHGVDEIVEKLIGDDIQLYRELLADSELKRFHLAPLGSSIDKTWRNKALTAMESGYTPDEIAEAALFGTGMMSWSGAESEMWAGKMDNFCPLLEDTDPRLSRIGEICVQRAAARREEALKQEKHEAVYGN